jgi:hypothetical protein
MHFHGEKESLLMFGLLSSRISYWLWRVEGDGFHLTKTFIKKLPFVSSEFSHVEIETVISNTVELWKEMSRNPIISNNSGVTSITYCPYHAGKNLDFIDETILKHFGFPRKYMEYFKDFVANTVIAGREAELGSNNNISLSLEMIR